MAKVYPSTPSSKNTDVANPIGGNLAFIMRTLRPLFRLSRYFGLFHYETDQSSIDFGQNHVISGIIGAGISIFGLTMFTFQLFSIVASILFKGSMTSIILQMLWFSSSFVSVALTIYGRVRKTAYIELNAKWNLSEDVIRIPEDQMLGFAHRCYLTYGILAFVSVTTLSFHSFIAPQYSTYVLDSWSRIFHVKIPILFYVGQSIVIAIWDSWVWVGCALLEIYCCVSAATSVYILDTIVEEINSLTVERIQCASAVHSSEEKKATVMDPTWVNEDDAGRRDASAKYTKHGPSHQNGKLSPFLKLLRAYQTVAAAQNDLNSFVGPLVYVDFVQIVVMICTVSYLAFEFTENFDRIAGIFFGLTTLLVVIRLFIIVILMGEVYSAGLRVNSALGTAISSGQFAESVSLPVLSHLNAYNASPIAFSAWGFFSVTRGTLLTTASVIATYLVVLVQS